jgi:hypothetical protein
MADDLLSAVMASALQADAPSLASTPRGVNVTLHRLRNRRTRAALARVPDRPTPLSLLRPHLDAARSVGVKADLLDAHHVLLNYDARNRDQWLAVDRLHDVARSRSTIEGDWSFASAPNNWIVIHFDYGACAGGGPQQG